MFGLLMMLLWVAVITAIVVAVAALVWRLVEGQQRLTGGGRTFLLTAGIVIALAVLSGLFFPTVPFGFRTLVAVPLILLFWLLSVVLITAVVAAVAAVVWTLVQRALRQ